MDQGGEWSKLLWMAEFTFNNAKNMSTGYSPFYLNYGRHPNPFQTHIDLEVPAVEGLMRHLASIHKSAEANLLKAKEHYKRQAE